MELSHARFIAEGVVSKLTTFCDRIQIAGSIRRQKPEVRDIEVLAIPKRKIIRDLFDNPAGEVAIPEFCDVVNQWKKVKGDPQEKYTQRELPEGIKLDLFIATKENWGYLLVIRTGSVEFSRSVASRWTKLGYRGVNGMLHKGERAINIYNERDLFNLLQMPWVEPKDRI